MSFVSNHLWDIFSVIKEERLDGDSLSPDVTNGLSLFLACVNGAKGTNYKCIEKLDCEKIKDEWESCDQGKAKFEYTALVLGDPKFKKADKYKDLSTAFEKGDKESFNKALKEGLSILNK